MKTSVFLRQILVAASVALIAFYILFPLSAAFILFCASPIAPRTHYRLVNAVLVGFAAVPTGFLTGLMAGLCSKGKEILTAIFAFVIVAALWCAQKVKVIGGTLDEYKVYWVIEMILGVLLLLCFVLIGAVVIRKIRHKKAMNADAIHSTEI